MVPMLSLLLVLRAIAQDAIVLSSVIFLDPSVLMTMVFGLREYLATCNNPEKMNEKQKENKPKPRDPKQ